MVKPTKAGTRSIASFCLALTTGCVSLSLPSYCSESDSNGVISPDSSVDRVEATYFNNMTVITATDMLRNLPGVSMLLKGATNGRGLGESSGNILVDGEKVGGKRNDALDYVSRIPAEDVDYIEVIRGNGTAYGVRNTGMLVNIVLKPDASALSGLWKLSLRHESNGTTRGDAQATLALRHGDTSYSFSTEAISRKSTILQTETLTRTESGRQKIFQQDDTREPLLFKISGSLAHETDKNLALKLNGYLERLTIDRLEASHITLVDGASESDGGTRDQTETGNMTEGELSATLIAPLGNSLYMELIAIHSREHKRETETIFENEISDSFRIEDEHVKVLASETIARTTLHWTSGRSYQLRFGAEGAYNTFESELDYAVAEDGGPLIAKKIDNSSANINEKRGELFGYLTWIPDQHISIDTGATYERSRIAQTGEGLDKARTLGYLKPAFRISVKQGGSLVWKAQIEKQVGQLNFEQFVSSVDSKQDKINQGNPELLPASSWQGSVGLDYKLPEDQGTLRLKGFYDDISNLVDNVPFGTDDSVTGNLEAASRFGVTFQSGLELQNMGILKGATLDTSITWQHSQVEDPFLHTTRRMAYSPTWRVRSTWRQKIPSLRLQGSISWNWRSETRSFDVDEYAWYSSNRGYLSASLSHTMPNNVKVSLGVQNLLGETDRRFRERFLVSSIDGRVKENELRYASTGQSVRLSLQSIF